MPFHLPTHESPAPDTQPDEVDRWALLDTLPHLACVVDTSGTILRVNRAWIAHGRRRGLGLPRGGVGSNYFDHCTFRRGDEVEQTARAVAAGLRTVLRTGEGRFSMDYPGLGEGDEECAWSVAIVPCEPTGAIIQHQDVTLQRQAERRRAVELALAERIGKGPTHEAVRRKLVSGVAAAAGWEAAVVWRHRGGKRPMIATSWRLDPRARVSERPVGGVELPPSGSPLVARVLRERGPCWSGPLEDEDVAIADLVFGRDHRFGSGFAVPYTLGDDDPRTVLFYGRHRGRPDPELLELVARAFGAEPAPRGSGVAVAPVAAIVEVSGNNTESTPLASLEREHIVRVLEACRYHMRRAAHTLGISRSTLYERARRYGIDLSVERRRARAAS